MRLRLQSILSGYELCMRPISSLHKRLHLRQHLQNRLYHMHHLQRLRRFGWLLQHLKSASLVAPRALAEPPSSPRPRTVPPHRHHRPRAITHTNQRGARVCAQGWGSTFATLPGADTRPRAHRVRHAPHHSTRLPPARRGGSKPTTASARGARCAPHHSTRLAPARVGAAPSTVCARRAARPARG